MAFLETPRFPECVSAAAGWTGGPGYQTDIVVVESGREHRNQVWSYPRHQYDASHAASLAPEANLLLDFWHVAAGMANGFRVKDWFDHTVEAGDGEFDMIDATHFQLVKVYVVGASERRRPISKPIDPVAVSGGTVASINYATGVVTMSSGTPTAWTGEFDVPCRFGADQMTRRVVTPKSDGSLLFDWDSIPIIEVRI